MEQDIMKNFNEVKLVFNGKINYNYIKIYSSQDPGFSKTQYQRMESYTIIPSALQSNCFYYKLTLIAF